MQTCRLHGMRIVCQKGGPRGDPGQGRTDQQSGNQMCQRNDEQGLMASARQQKNTCSNQQQTENLRGAKWLVK